MMMMMMMVRDWNQFTETEKKDIENKSEQSRKQKRNADKGERKEMNVWE